MFRRKSFLYKPSLDNRVWCQNLQQVCRAAGCERVPERNDSDVSNCKQWKLKQVTVKFDSVYSGLVHLNIRNRTPRSRNSIRAIPPVAVWETRPWTNQIQEQIWAQPEQISEQSCCSFTSNRVGRDGSPDQDQDTGHVPLRRSQGPQEDPVSNPVKD